MHLDKNVASPYEREALALWEDYLQGRGYSSRPMQRKMIETILATLSDLKLIQAGGVGVPFTLIEAPTGTGKTVAYLLAGMLMARHLQVKLVVSTSLLSLQAQILEQEIPALLENTGLDISYAPAKGRTNYLCIQRAVEYIDRYQGTSKAHTFLLDEEKQLTSEHIQTCQSMLDAVEKNEWDGDWNTWSGQFEQAQRSMLSADRHQCHKEKCPHFQTCCYYQARKAANEAQCVITNHSLVLLDMSLGGGVLLPAPDQCIYIFDEAHHLGETYCRQMEQSMELQIQTRPMDNLVKIADQLKKALDQLDISPKQYGTYLSFGSQLDTLRQTHAQLLRILAETHDPADRSDGAGFYQDTQTHVFKLDFLPQALRDYADEASQTCEQLSYGVHSAEQWLLKKIIPMLAGIDVRPFYAAVARLAACRQSFDQERFLWLQYVSSNTEHNAIWARWVEFNSDMSKLSCRVYARPATSSGIMHTFWELCAAAIFTSATLGGKQLIHEFARKIDFPVEKDNLHCLPSVFDYENVAEFVVPDIGCGPEEPQKHNRAVANYLNCELHRDGGSLVLFNSKQQMNAVIKNLDAKTKKLTLIQGTASASQLLHQHRENVDRNGRSAILGLASFAEGIDLPNQYCTQVIINKLGFPPPNTPVMRTLGMWHDKEGGNMFSKVSLPEATLRLCQCAGRLLRSETDSGRVVLLDQRIKTKSYGKKILAGLPPFRINFDA